MNAKKLFPLLFLFSGCFITMAISNISYAKSKYHNSTKHCDKIKKTAPKARCLDTVIEKTDRELQTWVNNQTFTLEELAIKTGRNSALQLFKRSQTAFIKYREDNCRWQYLAAINNSSSTIAYKKCYIYLSEDRIKELSQIKNNK